MPSESLSQAQTSVQAIQSADTTSDLYSFLDYDAYANGMHHNEPLFSLPEGTISTDHPPPPTLLDESGGLSPPHPLFSLKDFVQHGFGVRSPVFASETAGLGNNRKSGDVENGEGGALWITQNGARNDQLPDSVPMPGPSSYLRGQRTLPSFQPASTLVGSSTPAPTVPIANSPASTTKDPHPPGWERCSDHRRTKKRCDCINGRTDPVLAARPHAKRPAKNST